MFRSGKFLFGGLFLVFIAWFGSNSALANNSLVFSSTTPLPFPMSQHSVVADQGFLFVIGGSNFNYNSTIFSAKINTDGTLANFNLSSFLPQALGLQSSAVYNNYLYLLGGQNGVNTQSSIYGAKINPNGTLSSFSFLTSLPQSLSGLSAVSNNGYLYAVGGKGFNVQSTIYDVPINNDGTIGQFSLASFLPQRLYGQSTVIDHNYLYVVGGNNGVSDQSTVYSAPINSNGSIGVFTTLSYLPVPLSQGLSFISSGYLYSVGNNTFSGANSTVYAAPVNPDGSIGQWNIVGYLPQRLMQFGAAVNNNYLYVLGGDNGINNQSTVYFSHLLPTSSPTPTPLPYITVIPNLISKTFNGTGNNTIDVNFPYFKKAVSFTFSTWIDFDKTMLGAKVITWINGAADFRVGKNYLGFGLRNKTNYGVFPVATSIQGGAWRLVTFVYNGNTQKIYIDGNLVGSNNFGSDDTANATNTLRVGGSNTSFYQGQMQDMRFYTVALTGTQIQQLFSAGY